MAQGIHLRKYGAAATINFDLFEVDGVDFRVDAVHASGDTKVMKDEGAEANTTNAFTDEGQGYSIVLTATEMQAARVVIYVVDQTATKVWLDKSIVIETYGNASAQHALDLDDATGTGLSAIPWNASWDAEVESEVDDALGAAGADLTAIPWNAAWDAEVQSEVQDALDAAVAEPTGVPAANESLAAKISYLFMALRNRITITSTKKQFYDDGGAAEWEKDLSDDGTTYDETEGNAI